MGNKQAMQSRKGSFLVIGMLTIGIIAVGITYTYNFRNPPQETPRTLLQGKGVDAARRGISMSRAGRAMLGPDESLEIDRLYSQAFEALSASEMKVFNGLGALGENLTDRDIEEMGRLIQKAIKSLSPEANARLLALVERTVKLHWDGKDRPGPRADSEK